MSVLRTANVHFDGTTTVRIGKDNTVIRINGLPLEVNNELTVKGNTEVTGNVNVGGTLLVNGNPVGGAVDIYNDSVAATRYITFVDSTSGSASALNVQSVALTFNASTGQVSANDFNSLSDARLKEEITPLNDALLLIDTLNGVRFKWKGSDRKAAGILAQDLEKILPESVTGDKHVNHSGVIGLLVECVKELKREVELLKNGKENK